MDVAQVAVLHTMSREFISSTMEVDDLPAEFRNHMLDMNFLWISEDGSKRSLTTLVLEQTVFPKICPIYAELTIAQDSLRRMSATRYFDDWRRYQNRSLYESGAGLHA